MSPLCPQHKVVPKTCASRRACLDPFHTHYLLVDDGTAGQFGGEIGLRSNLEDELTSDPAIRQAHYARGTNAHRSDAARHVSGNKPMMILLVAGGGPGTLRTVFETLKKGRPVVVLRQSGGAAEHLHQYFENKGKFPASYSAPAQTVCAGDVRAACEKYLPQIYEMGSVRRGETVAGLKGHQRLSFYEPRSAKGSAYVLRESERFEHCVLNAMLFDCRDTSEAIFHTVCWSQPRLLERFVQSMDKTDPAGMARALRVREGSRRGARTSVV